MKRWIALLLCAALAAGVGLYAYAEPEPAPAPDAPGGAETVETADARLARVTQTVKDTLGLDTEAYTNFQGDVSQEELGNIWYLNWSGDGGSLSVEALEDGTVVSYWANDGQDTYYRYTPGLPVFPRIDAAGAKAAARAFLNRALVSGTETVVLEDPEANQLRNTAVRFSGRILLNGLESPLTYSVTVRGSDNTVTNFRRDAPSRSFLGAIPSPTPSVAQDAAGEALKGTVNLELIYVLPEADGKTAVLRYVPKGDKTYAVDAQTGDVVDVTGDLVVYNAARASGAAPMEEAAADMGLTAVELAGVEKLEGVLDQETLDRKIRSESAYMLDSYRVQSANYRLTKEKDNSGKEVERVLCTLRYTAGEDGDAPADRAGGTLYARIFTVDARTGAVRALYSADGWSSDHREPATAAMIAEETARAQAFLTRFARTADGLDAEKLELYDTEDKTADGAASYGFTFARKENGHFFPADACTVRVDRDTGAVSGVSYTWHDGLAFDNPDDLTSPEDALTAWVGTYDVRLAYRLLPRELDPAVAAEARLIDLNITRFYSLLLSYGLERDVDSPYAACPGIDAKTGKPVEVPPSESGEIAYSDISNSSAKADIEKLAAFGVGYTGGAFRPEKELTQWDAVCLLASVQGYRIDPESAEKEERDAAYDAVYNMSALTRSERNDDGALTRNGLVKLLLNSAGYGSVAKLSGIFTCDYTDRASIPAADLGYAALAQGLGMVRGTYSASSSASRADAAVMLCRLMEREA